MKSSTPRSFPLRTAHFPRVHDQAARHRSSLREVPSQDRDEPVLTIGIPTWSRSEPLKRLLDGILEQVDELTSQSRGKVSPLLEIIVAYDAPPTSDAKMLLDSIPQQYSRRGIVNARVLIDPFPTQNPSYSRYNIISIATGKYTLFISDVDQITYRSLSLLLEYLQKTTIDCLQLRKAISMDRNNSSLVNPPVVQTTLEALQNQSTATHVFLTSVVQKTTSWVEPENYDDVFLNTIAILLSSSSARVEDWGYFYSDDVYMIDTEYPYKSGLDREEFVAKTIPLIKLFSDLLIAYFPHLNERCEIALYLFIYRIVIDYDFPKRILTPTVDSEDLTLIATQWSTQIKRHVDFDIAILYAKCYGIASVVMALWTIDIDGLPQSLAESPYFERDSKGFLESKSFTGYVLELVQNSDLQPAMAFTKFIEANNLLAPDDALRRLELARNQIQRSIKRRERLLRYVHTTRNAMLVELQEYSCVSKISFHGDISEMQEPGRYTTRFPNTTIYDQNPQKPLLPDEIRNILYRFPHSTISSSVVDSYYLLKNLSFSVEVERGSRRGVVNQKYSIRELVSGSANNLNDLDVFGCEVERHVDHAIVLPFPLFASNYYHSLAEMAYGLRILDCCHDTNIPIVYQEDRFGIISALAPRLGVSNDRLIDLSEYRSLVVDKAIQPSRPPYYWSTHFVSFFRRFPPLSDTTGLVLAPEYARFYVSRSNSSRSPAYESQLEEALERMGISVIRPEDFSVEEQIALFANAQIIIAHHGAALANIAFASSKASVVEIFTRIPQN